MRRIRGRDPASSPRGRNLTGRGEEADGCVPDGQAAGKQRDRWHGQTFSQHDRHGHGRRKAAYPGSSGSAGSAVILSLARPGCSQTWHRGFTEKHQETYYQPEKILDWLEDIKPVSRPWWFAPVIPDSTAEAAA